ncbi:MAG: ribokinase [Anaerolineae bacterium]
MAAKIVIVGSFNTDLTTYMSKLPRPGETVNGRRFVTGAGGKGSNQAVAAARLGAQVTFVGRVGRDAFGDHAINTWKQEGIDTTYVIVDEQNPTGVAPIFVEDSGENMIVVALGANLALNREDVNRAENAIMGADVVIVQLEITPEISAYALEVARRHGVTTILNPAPAIPLPPEMIALADYVTPNETELETLAGGEKDIDAGARALLANDAQTFVVTLGGQGAKWITQSGTDQIGAFPVEVVDTTGAGDAFNGGFAVGLAEGLSLNEAIRFANATAGLAVTRPGTAPSMPQRAEVDALLARS